MNDPKKPESCLFGSGDLALPEELRGPLKNHLRTLREAYLRRGWAAGPCCVPAK